MHEAFRRRRGARPLVWGHRGVRGPLPENTMPAFARALDAGADGVELDVRLSRDDEVVVAHDATLARVSTARDPRAVADLDASELATIDLGGASIPRLADVLALARARFSRVNVELKHDVADPARLALRAAETIARHADADEWVIVSSFDPTLLARFTRAARRVAPDAEIATAFLFEPERPWLASGWPAAFVGATAVHPSRELVSARRVAAWRALGFVVNVFTVNDADEARRLAALGVDGVIGDDPGALVRALG